MPKPKTSNWLLINCGPLDKTYACSTCGRSVTEINCHFTPKGDYDLKAEAKELLEDYPYCHCGAKMSTEPNMRSKIKEFTDNGRRNWYKEIPTT